MISPTHVSYPPVDTLVLDPELARAHTSKVFLEHLTNSIRAIGLIEPIKIAQSPSGSNVVIDGVLRLEAIRALRDADPCAFSSVPAYEYSYDQRHAVRFQSDIYQDLLPSQLASLVEHLHNESQVPKKDIAAYIGVSAATIRNYTGLARMRKRGGYFSILVDLMDRNIVPSSNPYTWLRLTDRGLEQALTRLSEGEPIDIWMRDIAHGGSSVRRLSLKDVETATSGLQPESYREAADFRDLKRSIGLRRGGDKVDEQKLQRSLRPLLRRCAEDPALTDVEQSAARSLLAYLA